MKPRSAVLQFWDAEDTEDCSWADISSLSKKINWKFNVQHSMSSRTIIIIIIIAMQLNMSDFG